MLPAPMTLRPRCLRRRLPAAIALAALPACTPRGIIRTPDLDALREGKVYVAYQPVAGTSVEVVKSIVYFDVPAWRVWNLVSDLDRMEEVSGGAYRHVEVRSIEGDEALIHVVLPGYGLRPDIPILYRVRFDASTRTIAFRQVEGLARRFDGYLRWVPVGDGSQSVGTFYIFLDLDAPWTVIRQVIERSMIDQSSASRRLVHDPRYAFDDGKNTFLREGEAKPRKPRPRLAIEAFDADEEDRGLARTLTQVFTNEADRATGGSFEVVSDHEIASFLDFEKRQSVLECKEGEACAADLGKLLRAEKVVMGRLGRVGKSYVLSTTLIAVAGPEVQGRAVEEVPGAEGLLPAAKEAAHQLFGP